MCAAPQAAAALVDHAPADVVGDRAVANGHPAVAGERDRAARPPVADDRAVAQGEPAVAGPDRRPLCPVLIGGEAAGDLEPLELRVREQVERPVYPGRVDRRPATAGGDDLDRFGDVEIAAEALVLATAGKLELVGTTRPQNDDVVTGIGVGRQNRLAQGAAVLRAAVHCEVLGDGGAKLGSAGGRGCERRGQNGPQRHCDDPSAICFRAPHSSRPKNAARRPELRSALGATPTPPGSRRGPPRARPAPPG